MKVGDLVRWWNNGDLGAIIKDEGGGEYFVYFFNGVTSWCIKSEIIPVVKAQK